MLNLLLRFLSLLNRKKAGHFRTQKTRVLDEVDIYLQTSERKQFARDEESI